MENNPVTKARREPRRRRAAALAAVFDATAALFHRLRAVAAEVHGQGELTAGRRGVLRDLSRWGPQTVPAMARRRPVSRQHIQLLVNALVADGLIEAKPNPAHRRSSLFRLTARGKTEVARMLGREARLLAAAPVGLSERDLAEVARVLRGLREFLESASWRRLVEGARR